MIRLDMPERDYHAHLALNASTLKAVHKHPLKKVRHDLDNRAAYNPAFTLGSAAHRLILEGTGDGIVLIDKPDYRTKEARVSRDAALAAGSIPLLPHEYDQVVAMCAAVKEDATAAKTNLWRVAELAQRPMPTSKDVDEMSVRMDSAYASLFALFIASERLIEDAAAARVAKDRLVAQSKTHDQDEEL